MSLVPFSTHWDQGESIDSFDGRMSSKELVDAIISISLNVVMGVPISREKVPLSANSFKGVIHRTKFPGLPRCILHGAQPMCALCCRDYRTLERCLGR